MLILLAAYQKYFQGNILCDMKYEVKPSEMTFLLIMLRKFMSKY